MLECVYGVGVCVCLLRHASNSLDKQRERESEMNRKTKDGWRANRGGRGRWAGTRPGAKLSRATGSSMCFIGPTCLSHSLSVFLSSQEASQPLNLTSKSKGLELRGKTPSPQALELGSLGLQGGFRPRDLQREAAHSPQRSALSKSCLNCHRHSRPFMSQSMNQSVQEEWTHWVSGIFLSVFFYFLSSCSTKSPQPAIWTTSVQW